MELDVLTVRLDADIADLQAQLDRARASLAKYAADAEPAAKATASIGAESSKSVPGINKLNNAMVTLTRQMTGLPPIAGTVIDVFGTMALGASAMIPVLIGASGLAWAISQITKESREAAQAVDELGKRLDRLAQSQIPLWKRTAGEAIAADIQVARARQRVQEVGTARTIQTDTGEFVTIRPDPNELQKALDDLETWEKRSRAAWKAVHAEGVKTFDDISKVSTDAAQDFTEAWAQAARDAAFQMRMAMVDITKELDVERLDRAVPGGREVGGFIIPDVPIVKAANDALDDLGTAAADVAKGLQLIPKGPGELPKEPGFFSRMLDPKQILSGIATGFITTGINALIGPVVGKLQSGLTTLIGGVLGLSDATDEAARNMRRAMTTLDDAITEATGTDIEKAFINVRNRIQATLDEAGLTIDLSGARTFEEIIAIITQYRDAFADMPFMSGVVELLNKAITLATGEMGRFGETVASVTDTLRNIPAGFKVALAQYNATIPTATYDMPTGGVGVGAGTVGTNLSIHITAEPEGIFRTVEAQAVQVKRSGGRPNWELVQ